MNKITGSEIVIQSLLDNNVDIVFGYPGGAIMPIYDALYDYKNKLRHILVRHEQGAAHAAEGYARITGKPGVCFATSGPGATNLVTGIADAILDSIPLVCITGQVASSLVGTDAFQEVDVIGITAPITKWNYQVTDASEIQEIIYKAFVIATSGRPGPVVIDITKDAQFALAEYHATNITRHSERSEESLAIYQHNSNKLRDPSQAQDDKYLQIFNQQLQAADLINTAKKPLILAGHGVLIANATKELKQFSEKSSIPVACTLLGLTSFPTDHPLYAGMLGMHGNYAPNVLTNESDLIIAIGMRFDDRVTGRTGDYARQAKIIHIDIDASEFNKNVAVDIALHSDAKEALQQLLPLVKKNTPTDWITQFKTLYSEEYDKVIQSDITPQPGQPTKMAEVIHMLSEKTKGQAIIVTDVGQHQMTTARHYNHQHPNHFITSGGAGTMGFALPAAIGAKVAAPNKEVIAIIGDGGFQMTLQELGTIMQEKLAIKIVILNNHFLGMVRQWQEMFFDNRYSYTSMQNPDFIQIAKAYSISGEKVLEKENVTDALNRLLQSTTAYVLDIDVEKETNVFPMIPTGASVDEIRLQ